MTKKIKLKDVTEDNWEEVTELELADDQKHLVADNSYSLAESKFNPYAVPRAIYAGKKLVGFIMYETLHEEDEPGTYSVYRFMIDKKHQGKGYGRRALQQALREISRNDDCRRITICYVPSNTTTKQFYASLGFRDIGLDEDGEMIAEILPSEVQA
jgi:diamine N-acetyltransferase